MVLIALNANSWVVATGASTAAAARGITALEDFLACLAEEGCAVANTPRRVVGAAALGFTKDFCIIVVCILLQKLLKPG